MLKFTNLLFIAPILAANNKLFQGKAQNHNRNCYNQQHKFQVYQT
jgi:hypothetical protein